MRHLVVGTAGHIDHGKSALVHALTGIDPDRLKEEQERGITIELGFADLELDAERVISFVDVPGHERFVRHMVAGATGIDAVVLVVAADEGVQPQTREHLAICSLLGVGRGLVALTKCDLVERELIEVVALEVEELLARTPLAGAPLLPVSARSGAGLDSLRDRLRALCDEIPPRPSTGIARLPIDRSFVLRGFGTVVTGTLVSGGLDEGQEVEILPGGRRARIRGLQIHRRKVARAAAGRRTAVNLQGIDHDEVPRGSTLVEPGALATTRRVWARVELLPEAPEDLKRGGPVRLHHGTAAHAARLRVFAARRDPAPAELVLAHAAVLAPGDRFILRRPAPVDTVGGGVVVDAHPPRARPGEADPAFSDAALELTFALALRLSRAGASGRDLTGLAAELGRSRVEIEDASRALVSEGAVAAAGGRFFDGPVWQDAARRVVELASEYHREQPLQNGISREALRARVAPAMPLEAWRDLLDELSRRSEVRLLGECVARPEHRVVLGESEQALADRIAARYREAGLDPPEIGEVLTPEEERRAGPIVELLVARGELVRIESRRFFHAEALEGLRVKLRTYALRSKTIDVATFKELAGVTRKNAIPLLEHLDGERATRRVGDKREILL